MDASCCLERIDRCLNNWNLQACSEPQVARWIFVGIGNGREHCVYLQNSSRVHRKLLLDTWCRWHPDDWVDVENHKTDEEWEAIKCEVFERFAGREDVELAQAEESAYAKYVADGSLDLIWLDANGCFTHIWEGLHRWWPKLKQGGIIGGTRCQDAFIGDAFAEQHTWLATHEALRLWRQKTGYEFFVTKDDPPAWVMFKSERPKPEDILVVSAAMSNLNYREFTEKNHRQYCKRRGYRYRMLGDEGFASDRWGTWVKIKAVQAALREAKWVFWLDADAVFCNWELGIERLCINPFQAVMGYWRDHINRLRPSTGTMLFQQGHWSDAFLEKVWLHPDWHWEGAFEEDAMRDLLEEEPEHQKEFLLVDLRVMNSLPAFQVWGWEDHILHLQPIKNDRGGVIEDVCRRIEVKWGVSD